MCEWACADVSVYVCINVFMCKRAYTCTNVFVCKCVVSNPMDSASGVLSPIVYVSMLL